jgi:hypothetical protein
MKCMYTPKYTCNYGREKKKPSKNYRSNAWITFIDSDMKGIMARKAWLFKLNIPEIPQDFSFENFNSFETLDCKG